MILNPIEIVFWQEEDRILWEYPESIRNVVLEKGCGIEYHAMKQISKAFVRENEYLQPFKYLNPWTIKTPKNYSCLFTNPFNRDDDGIRLIDGIVDTDTYHQPVNFPFIINGDKYPEFNDVIKKGTPYVQIIPFKREAWKMKIHSKNPSKKLTNIIFNSTLLHKYRNLFWHKKTWT